MLNTKAFVFSILGFRGDIEVIIGFGQDQRKIKIGLLNGSFAVVSWYRYLRVRILTLVDFYD